MVDESHVSKIVTLRGKSEISMNHDREMQDMKTIEAHTIKKKNQKKQKLDLKSTNGVRLCRAQIGSSGHKVGNLSSKWVKESYITSGPTMASLLRAIEQMILG